MKKMSFERMGIIIFCATLIISSAYTLSGQVKSKLPNIKSNPTSLIKIGGKVKESIVGLESSINQNVFRKTDYINLFGLSAKLLKKHYIIENNPANSVVKDNHEDLQFICFEVDTMPYVKEISKVKEVLDEMNTPLLYVQTPLKTIEDYVKMPEGIIDYANKNTDEFMLELEEAGIEMLDLRENIKTSGLDYNELFYTTDHHWKTETAFWAVGEVTDYLKQHFKIDLDPNNFYTNEQNYHSVFYEKSFLGSQGRRVGKYYGGVDDYTLILPSYDTDYSVTINKTHQSSVAEGTFEDAMVKYYLLRPKDIFTNRYAAYFGADFPEVIINNHGAAHKMKVLIFKDSFGLPFSAFFSTMVGETRLLDTRYYQGNIEEYIRHYDPDLVLYVYKSINTQA